MEQDPLNGPDPSPPPGAPRPGDRIGGRYTLAEQISEGAMGTVHRARDDEGREYALKHLLDPAQAVRFEIEARLLMRLRHPRVVRVLEYIEDPSGQYFAMALVEGPDLAKVLRERGDPGLPAGEAVGYALQACEALQYVHEQGIVHRDVKPQNLILGEQGIVLVDFGIAREVRAGDAGTRAVGTPRYMAPEIMVGESVSPRSDVYGLAATLWALIAGEPPIYHDPLPLAERFPGVTPELESTLRRTLELAPERRVASAEAFAAALGSPLGVSEGASLAISLPRPEAQRALLEAVVRTAAAVFDAAAASIALRDDATGELIYQAAWGTAANEIVGVRLRPGQGIAGAVLESGEGTAIPDCRSDHRFAAQIAAGTGYIPITMLVVPMLHEGSAVGILTLLDGRGGALYGPADLPRAELFADLAVAALPALG